MKLVVLAVVSALSLYYFALSDSEYVEAVAAYDRYCENVQFWESSSLPNLDKPGHPNYKGLSCFK